MRIIGSKVVPSFVISTVSILSSSTAIANLIEDELYHFFVTPASVTDVPAGLDACQLPSGAVVSTVTVLLALFVFPALSVTFTVKL